MKQLKLGPIDNYDLPADLAPCVFRVPDLQAPSAAGPPGAQKSGGQTVPCHRGGGGRGAVRQGELPVRCSLDCHGYLVIYIIIIIFRGPGVHPEWHPGGAQPARGVV